MLHSWTVVPGITVQLLLLGILQVGPGKPYARLEDALKAAQPGDTIEVYAAAKAYDKVALFVTKANLTFRAVPAKKGERVGLSGEGFDYSGSGSTPRAVFQFNQGADGCVVEGFEISGARNGSHNGAAIRINQANHVTIRDCDLHDNDMGIMSNGDGTAASAVNQRIERCLIHHNGSDKDPGYNHNLYLGGASVTLSGCEVHHSLTGHNVKSRAHHTRVEYSFIHDSANREFDLVDADETALPESHAVLFGNLIVKAKGMTGNKTVIHFGQDGGKEHDGTITLAHNTIVTPYVSPIVELDAPKARAHFVGNIVWDGGAKQQGRLAASKGDLFAVSGSHNWMSPSFDYKETRLDRTKTWSGADPGFADASKHDYRPTAAGLADAGPRDLKLPEGPGMKCDPPLAWQYKHPASLEKRKSDRKPDLGAVER